MLNLKFTKNEMIEFCVFLFLFLASMNFNAKFFYFTFASFILVMILRKKISLNNECFVYILLSCLLSLYNLGEGVVAVIRSFSYFLFYLVGYNMIKNCVSQSNKIIDKKKNILECSQKILFSISLGSFVHYLLNYLINIGEDLGRNTKDIWTGTTMSATLQVSISCLMLGLAIALILKPQKKHDRYLGFFCLIIMLIYNLVLAGRTMIFIIFIVFCLAMFFLLKNNKEKKYNEKLVFGIILIVLLCIVIYMFNIFGVQDMITGSNLYNRFFETSDVELLESSREDNKLFYLKNMIHYPLGGLNMRNEVGYAHDLLLDGYDEYGILSLGSLIFILVLGVKNIWIFVKNKEIPLTYRLTYLCVYASILLEFCVEPIFAGAQWLFVCFCLINGNLKAVNANMKILKECSNENSSD